MPARGQYMASMSPDEIRFTQDSISNKFQDGNTIFSTFQDLYQGNITVDGLPSLHVVNHNGNYLVVKGNRRLYVYKKLQEYGKLNTVLVVVKPKVEERFEKMHTTSSDGTRIRIRGEYKRGDQTYVVNNQIQNFVTQEQNKNRSWGRSSRYTDRDYTYDSYRESTDYDLGAPWRSRTSTRTSYSDSYRSQERPGTGSNEESAGLLGTIVSAVTSAWRWLTG